MRCTVVVVTFNSRRHIGRCLDATLPTLTLDDELVVVDNASTDGTPELIRRCYPAVRVLESAANRGFGAGSNLGARGSSAKYLAFLNPDTQPQSGWLDALLKELASLPAPGLATAKLLLAHQPTRVDTFGNSIHISGITTCRGWGQSASGFQRTDVVPAISGACFAMSRDLFERLGGFDERLFMYYEDVDLSMRARLAGASCVAVPGALVLHDHAAGFSPQKLRWLERNRWWSLLKLLAPRTLVAIAPLLLAGSCLAWALAARGGLPHVRATVLAYVDLLSWLPDLAAARRRAQAQRRIDDAELLALHSARLPLLQISSGPFAARVEQVLTNVFGGGRRLASLLGVR